ncbi:MAG: malto-oligosyltrehalose trehalohydrolase, partial [Gemmatimonadetes bacterium]|nr:malto-oligosyltrehalose trehalohydrolase [Gemmatimonadota bacterium]
MTGELALGAHYLGGGRSSFRVWAPASPRLEVVFTGPVERVVPLEPGERGYHVAVVDDVAPGALYHYRLSGGRELPDPASRFQPLGVHGPSQVVDSGFAWSDVEWAGIALEQCVFYELHVGTYTAEGTFAAIAPHVRGLRELGITVLELMPVAQFPGSRNWGYDGVLPFAVQNSY